MKKIFALMVAGAVLLSAVGCTKDEDSSEEAAATASPTPTVTEYSAPMTALNETKIYSSGRGEIIECSAEEGDFVEAGQLLYRLDDNGLYDNIATTRNSIEKANIAIGTAEENEANLKIYAPASGIIKNLNIKEGERVNTGTVAKIVNEDEFVARVPFNSAQIGQISVGMKAEIISDDMMSGTPASVTRIYSERNTSVTGAVLYDVEFRGKNPGTLNEGMSVNASVGGINSPASGYIDESDGDLVVSRQSGNAGKIYVSDGERVKKGQLIMTIENSNITATAQRARIDKKDLEIKLRSLENDAADLTIYAPISGIVTEKNKDIRDSIASKSDSVMTISDSTVLKLEITVDSEKKLPENGSPIKVYYDGGELQGTVTSAADGVIDIDIPNTQNVPPNTMGTIKL